MEEITTLVATLVLPAIITAVPICCVVNALKGHPRPLRAAVEKAQTLVASGAVWLALTLVALYGLLESVDRWGVRVLLGLLLGLSVVFSVMLGVVDRLEGTATRIACPRPRLYHQQGRTGVLTSNLIHSDTKNR